MAKSYRTVNIRVSTVNKTKQEGEVLYILNDMYKTLDEWASSTGLTYWLIEHPADDEVSQTHFHMVIKFKTPMPFGSIKKRFPYGDIEGSKNIRASVQYLIHLNDKTKRQFDWSDIKTNCLDMSPYMVLSRSQQEITLQSICNEIFAGNITEFNLYEKIPGDIFTHHRSKIENALTFYKRKLYMNKERDIRVIFMSGVSGIGKSTFARMLCDDKKLSYCVSSSSNDPLQDYSGEHAIILDDARDDVFKYHDFLKFTDHHVKSTTQSRYNNKAFIGELIIITSTKPINNWYYKASSEDKKQLYRRVSEWLRFEGDKINRFVYNENVQRYQYVGSSDNPVPDLVKIKQTESMNFYEGTRTDFAYDSDYASNYEYKAIPEATEEEKEARKAYEASLPKVNQENLNKYRVG